MGVYRQSSPPVHVKIPVLPYVQKVMLHEYGPEPIFVSGQTLLGKYFHSFPLDFPELEDVKVHGVVMVFAINRNLYSHFKQYNTLFQCGCYFEKVVQRMLLQHIEAARRFDAKILDAIEDFFEMYGITEEEWRMDAAYALWKSHKKKRAKHLGKVS